MDTPMCMKLTTYNYASFIAVTNISNEDVNSLSYSCICQVVTLNLDFPTMKIKMMISEFCKSCGSFVYFINDFDCVLDNVIT